MTLTEIKSKLSDAHYLCISKPLIHNLTVNGAIIYTELVTRACHYEQQGTLKDGFFFCTVDDLEYETSLTQRQQTPVMKDLAARGLIAVAYKGVPKRRYIRVLTDQKAVERAFEDTRERKEKKSMPENIKEKCSGDFDPEILDRELVSVAKEHGADEETCAGVRMIYRQYIGFFGKPEKPFSRSSVWSIMENADSLNSEYDIFDSQWFNSLLEEYSKVEVEKSGFIRSINNMLCDEMLKILQERAK